MWRARTVVAATAVGSWFRILRRRWARDEHLADPRASLSSALFTTRACSPAPVSPGAETPRPAGSRRTVHHLGRADPSMMSVPTIAPIAAYLLGSASPARTHRRSREDPAPGPVTDAAESRTARQPRTPWLVSADLASTDPAGSLGSSTGCTDRDGTHSLPSPS